MKYRFEEIVETAQGAVLTRNDGKVARMDDVYLYPITRWKGRDFRTDPPPAGQWPAITVDYEGARILSEPRPEATELRSLPFHTPLWVDATPATPDGHWWRIPDAGGPGVPGYAEDVESLRHPTIPPSLPDGVGADETWVDVDLAQQTLMIRKGAELEYWTVIASGAPPMGTPLGTYRILAKYAYKDMQSRPGAEDVYRVEDVPWTMIFRPAYALHAAYWHWGFGRVASHGCVNLAVRDAKELFERLGIGLPAGWLAIFPTEAESVVIRVRRGDDVGRDRRAEFSSL
jgi:lipoprotein-anchoring transpeptidase ErfK/SrfK